MWNQWIGPKSKCVPHISFNPFGMTFAATARSRSRSTDDTTTHEMTTTSHVEHVKSTDTNPYTSTSTPGPIEPILEQHDSSSPSKPEQPSQQQTLIVSLICGMVFGMVFQLSHVHEFFFIRSQMLFQHEIMLKMFLSASATSILWLSILPHIKPTWRKTVQNGANMMCQTVPQHRGLMAASIGGGMIGMGMTICGSCPGTVYAQLGAGSIKAVTIMVGGFIAALVYPMLELIPGWTGLITSIGKREWQSYTIPTLIRSVSRNELHDVKKQEKQHDPTPESRYAIGFASLLALVILMVEYLVPWDKDVRSFTKATSISPIWAGIIVGSLQFPLITLVGTYLGTSSAYITVMANVWNSIWKQLHHRPTWTQHIPLFTSLQHNYWQVMLAIGVYMGAFLSSSITHTKFASDTMISYTEAVMGGFLLVMGSRMAAGCTSGHGISGMGFLGINSIFTVACMFGGGIATALLFYH